MLGWVEAQYLFCMRNAQTNNHVDAFTKNERANSGKGQRGQNSDDLLAEEFRVAEEETVGTGRVQRLLGEQAGGERTPDAANPVNCEDIERVVDPESLLQCFKGEEAEQAGTETNNNCR